MTGKEKKTLMKEERKRKRKLKYVIGKTLIKKTQKTHFKYKKKR